jgi:hypothetical protein
LKSCAASACQRRQNRRRAYPPRPYHTPSAVTPNADHQASVASDQPENSFGKNPAPKNACLVYVLILALRKQIRTFGPSL